jgi:hypothetical protein
LTVAKQERTIRIEVERGLEGKLTDPMAGRIIDLVTRYRSPRMINQIHAGRIKEVLEQDGNLHFLLHSECLAGFGPISRADGLKEKCSILPSTIPRASFALLPNG